MVTLDTLKSVKIGWVPASKDVQHPADRRRFGHVLNRLGLSWEVANPKRKYDLVVLSQAADISIWKTYEGGKVVFDFCDSYLAESPWSMKPYLRGLAKFATRSNKHLQLSYVRALGQMCTRADAVVCATDEQQEKIAAFCNNVHQILDFQSDPDWVVKETYFKSTPLNLVWEGFSAFEGFRAIMPALRKFGEKHPFRLHLVTDLMRGRYLNNALPQHTKSKVLKTFPFSGVYLYEWEKFMVSRIIASSDLALIPIPDDPFWLGKPANKLLFFWRIGIPTLTSSTPAYEKVMAQCGVDMVCHDDEQWYCKLNLYSESTEARREAGRRVKDFVETYYSESVMLERWLSMMTSVL